MKAGQYSWLVLISLLLACSGAAAAANKPQDGGPMLGFGISASSRQRALEQRFDAQLDPIQLRRWLKQLSAGPNQVGSPHDKTNAKFLLAKFRQWGWDAHIETFNVSYPTPRKLLVQLVAPTTYTAKLHEPPVAGDPSSSLPGALPPYNVYSADGDVTADLVYVNYGMPDDYKTLARQGVSVRGKIVIARYGRGFRALKPRLAAKHGAIGCIIYSDPRDDGYFKGDTYPKGGWRPPQGVQRGSVQDMAYPGDPLTPGWGSTPDARRISPKDSKTLMTIPVLPISYADAKPLLAALGGPVAPANWRGALPFTYHIGPGPAKVHLVVESDWKQEPIYDVIAKLKGSTWPDQWVIRGNHHDGWVFGAYDPLAGTVAQMAEARAMGKLYKQGWRPQRTLVYASWDGEEAGMLGSIEWGETHAKELKKKAVLYVNSDTNGRGFLHAGGNASLQHLVNQVTAGVADPETGASVRKRLRARMLVAGARPDARPDTRTRAALADKGGDLPIGALGSGSDYAVFLDHLGIASLSFGFSGEDEDSGIYHSRYDSFAHYTRFGDPTFEYGVALAKIAGHTVMRMADAKVLPFQFGDFSRTLDRYLDQLHKMIDNDRKATTRQHRLMSMHAYRLASDPTRPVAPPVREADVPKVDLAPLDQAAKRLERSAKAFHTAYAKSADDGFAMPEARLQQLNSLMGRMGQALTDADGLPGRPWYKNMIYAPGRLTGYGAKTVTAVREAIEGHRWKDAGHYAAITAEVLDGYRQQLDKITGLLRNPGN